MKGYTECITKYTNIHVCCMETHLSAGVALYVTNNSSGCDDKWVGCLEYYLLKFKEAKRK